MVVVDGWRIWWLLLGLCFFGFFLKESCDLMLGEPHDFGGEVLWGVVVGSWSYGEFNYG